MSATTQAPAAAAAPAARPVEDELDAMLPNLMLGIRDIVIVVTALVVLGLCALLVVYHYKDAKDAVAALGVIAPAISAIAGAAFGIAVGGTAGAAVGKTGARAALNETEKKRQQAGQTQAQVSDLKETLAGLIDMLTALPSPAGTNSFLVDPQRPDLLESLPGPIEIPASDIAAVREKLASIETSLAAIAQ